MPDTRHLAIQDGRPSDTAFRTDREARAALTAWLRDGTEIFQRCRVGPERRYLSGLMVEFAGIAMYDWCAYQGIAPCGNMRQDAERIIAECNTERVIEP